MNKLKLVASLLAIALAVSIGINVYLQNQTTLLNDQKTVADVKLDMVSVLSEAQGSALAQLQQIGDSLTYASTQLSTLGISGDEARSVVAALAANSSFIIDAATQDLNNTMIIVEPSQYHDSEGKNIGEQNYLNTNPNAAIEPVMTPVIPLVEGISGVAMAAPVFNSSGVMIGTVSVIFDPASLLNATVGVIVADTPYAVTIMQTNSLTIFDTDASQIGKVLFTDPVFAGFSELLAMGQRVSVESSGYGTYSYTLPDSSQPVEKECYWTTISIYGAIWRLALIHAVNA